MCVCVCVCFFVLMHGHSFEQIWTKFGMWYPYTVRVVSVVTVVTERCSSPRARAPRAVHTPLQMSGELRREVQN